MTNPPLLMLMALATGSARASAIVQGPESQLKSVADDLHSSVLEIRARASLTLVMERGQEQVEAPSLGTGVLVGEGLAVTTLHTIGTVLPGKLAAWSQVEAVIPDVGIVPAQIVAWFPEWDLAVLRIAEGASVATAPFATETPARGDALLLMGIGDDAITGVGVTVAGVSGDQLVLTGNRRIDSRYWGGPLFDVHGRLAGIALASAFPRALSAAALAMLLERLRGR